MIQQKISLSICQLRLKFVMLICLIIIFQTIHTNKYVSIKDI